MANQSSYKTQHKRRMISDFIDSAESIIISEGINAISLRKVCHSAGYNSATLYHYFDNLDHLLFFVGMRFLDKYNKEMLENYNAKDTAIEQYLYAWRCFIEHTYDNPEIFYKIFLEKSQRDLSARMKEYYQVFPFDNSELKENFTFLYEDISLGQRESVFISNLVASMNITPNMAKDMSEAILLLYEGQLSRVYRSINTSEEAKEKSLYFLEQLSQLYCGK